MQGGCNRYFWAALAMAGAACVVPLACFGFSPLSMSCAVATAAFRESVGARGLKLVRDAGACAVAQDEASSMVFGMPKEAIKLDATDRAVPLRLIACEIAGLAAV